MIDRQPSIQVHVSHCFAASAERVFDAWLDPARAGRWLFATADGEMTRVEIDPRVGGTFTIVERRAGHDAEHFGEYLEIDRPRRLVFTFGADRSSPDRAIVTIEITPIEDGCELVLVQEMSAEWANYAERSEAGWAMILGNLDAQLPAPD